MDIRLKNVIESWQHLSEEQRNQIYLRGMMTIALRHNRQWRKVQPRLIGDQRKMVIIGSARRRASDGVRG